MPRHYEAPARPQALILVAQIHASNGEVYDVLIDEDFASGLRKLGYAAATMAEAVLAETPAGQQEREDIVNDADLPDNVRNLREEGTREDH